MNEHIHFLSSMILDFKNVGAMLPSSRYLAERMARTVAAVAEDGDMVFELGPGTGVISKEILRTLNRRNISYTAIERNGKFVEILTNKFPNQRIIHGNAKDIHSYFEEFTGKVQIVSSLPLNSMDRIDVKLIIDACFEVLEFSGGYMFQYSYFRQNPIRHRLVDTAVVCTVYRNFPPATIWRYQPRRISTAPVLVPARSAPPGISAKFPPRPEAPPGGC